MFAEPVSDATPRPRDRSSSEVRAKLGAYCVIALLVATALINPYHKAAENLILGIVVTLAGLAPTYFWMRDADREPVPIIVLMGGFYALCYGAAAFVTPAHFISGLTVSEPEYTVALMAALLSLSAIYGGYYFYKWRAADKLRKSYEISESANLLVLYAVVPAIIICWRTLKLLHITAFDNILEPIQTQFFAWIAYCTFSGRYKGTARIVALVAIAYLSYDSGDVLGGRLFGLFNVGLVLGLAFIAGTKRIPLIAFSCLLILAIFLQIGKGDYRTLVWNRVSEMSTLEKVERYYQLSSYRLARGGAGGALNDAYSRYNLLHLSGAIMARTPGSQPFLGGFTYLPIVTKLVPRALWPNKPVERLGNQWARTYGFLGANDIYTTLNLPWLPEMYMNFGWAGVLAISLLVGMLGAFLHSTFMSGLRDPLRFSAAVTLALPLAVPESNASISIGVLLFSLVTTRCVAAALLTTGVAAGESFESRELEA